MKTPTVIVAAALTAAILLTATFLIATGTRGEVLDKDPVTRIGPSSRK